MDFQFVSSVHAHQVQPTVSILISSLFWDVTQRRIVVNYRPFGKIYRALLQGSISPTTSKMGPLGCPATSVNTTLRCVIPQKIENLIYTLAEAWNYAQFVSQEFVMYLPLGIRTVTPRLRACSLAMATFCNIRRSTSHNVSRLVSVSVTWRPVTLVHVQWP